IVGAVSKTLGNPATVEAYLQAGMTPRFIERALQIESATRRHRTRLERTYKRLRRDWADDPYELSERWQRIAQRWSFADVNALIAEHNRWYAVEPAMQLSPRMHAYVTL